MVEEKKDKGKQKTFEEIMAKKLPKFDKSHESTSLRFSTNSKNDKQRDLIIKC